MFSNTVWAKNDAGTMVLTQTTALQENGASAAVFSRKTHFKKSQATEKKEHKNGANTTVFSRKTSMHILQSKQRAGTTAFSRNNGVA